MRKNFSVSGFLQCWHVFCLLVCCVFLGMSGALCAEEAPVSIPSGTDVLFPGQAEESEEYSLLRQQLKASRGGNEINKQDESGLTPLMRAAKLNDRLVVAWLLAKNAATDVADVAGKTAADYTTDESIREAILLCRNDKSPLSPEEKEQLAEIPYANLAEMVERTGGDAPASLRLLVLLLRSGQNARDIDYHPRMGLLFASILFRHWFDIRKAAEHYYSRQISPEFLRLAIALGFRADTRDSLKQLLFAEAIDDTNLMRAVLTSDPNLLRKKNILGQIAGHLVSADAFRVLMDFGFDAKIRWRERETGLAGTLIYSVCLGKASSEVLCALLENGVALPSLPEGANFITFYILSCRGDVKAVQALIEAGVDINKVGTPGKEGSIAGIPPVVAASFSSPRILRFLLSKGRIRIPGP